MRLSAGCPGVAIATRTRHAGADRGRIHSKETPMSYSPNFTTREAIWRMRAVQLASVMPKYRSAGGKRLHARTPGAARQGPALDLSPGCVVSFRFPFLDRKPDYDDAQPNRPALIVERDDTADSLVIAYGTSRKNRANAGYEIFVNKDRAVCGLTKPTRFVLARRIRVSRHDARFVTHNDGLISGILPVALMKRLHQLHCKLTTLYGDEELRHVHEWIGANCCKDRDKIAKALQTLRSRQYAAA